MLARVGSDAAERSAWNAVQTGRGDHLAKWLDAIDLAAKSARLVADAAAEIGVDLAPMARRAESIAWGTRKLFDPYATDEG